MSLRCPDTVLACFICLGAGLLLAGCEREQRPTRAPPAASGTGDPSFTAQGVLPADNRYEDNAYAVSQGKVWFRTYNCNGCHGQGGGDSGPALMDGAWRYGADPASVYASIAHGRPNGMPAFGQRLPEDQIWQLAAYVRSMSGQLRIDVAPSRSDTLQASEPEGRREKAKTTVDTSGRAGQ